MSDFLKKFKGIFVAEEGGNATPQSTAASTPATPASTTPAPERTAAPVHTPHVSGSGKANDRFVEILLTSLEKNNQEGFDYFEFKESLKSLAKMPLDEKTRFQSAFAMAQTMGATPDKLKSSASFYLSILKGELNKFEEAHKQQRARLIGDREAELQNLQQIVQNKAEQIKQLTKDIEDSNKRIGQIKGEVESSTVKIENTRLDFEATYAVVVSQIEADLQKIAEYLK